MEVQPHAKTPPNTHTERGEREGVMASSISHFTHPEHRLVRNEDEEALYDCDICQGFDVGQHYHCEGCDFHIHDECAKLPKTLSSHTHPWHELSLLPCPDTVCDLCTLELQGFSYRCPPCGFDLHPSCPFLAPQTVQSMLHPAHRLFLVPGVVSICSACEEPTSSWTYRCGLCGVKLHIECVLEAVAETEDDGGGGDGGDELGPISGEATFEILTERIANLFRSHESKVVGK